MSGWSRRKGLRYDFFFEFRTVTEKCLNCYFCSFTERTTEIVVRGNVVMILKHTSNIKSPAIICPIDKIICAVGAKQVILSFSYKKTM